MDITKVVAKARFIYHTNMLDVNNVLNQLGIRDDEKAEECGKYHCLQAFDCIERLTGLSMEEILEKTKKD